MPSGFTEGELFSYIGDNPNISPADTFRYEHDWSEGMGVYTNIETGKLHPLHFLDMRPVRNNRSMLSFLYRKGKIHEDT